ncbi:MAG: NAD(P)/FAD-dependent oxidoreductase, partial [Sulfuricaulis sp.]|nr:NAD(P)/FAD-dependent oxidoreductase [Sulfuricaulis sp.]
MNTQIPESESPDSGIIKNTRTRLDGADIVPLAMSLIHLTGDLSLLDLIAPHVRGAWEHQESVPPELASQLRERMAAELERIAAGGAPGMTLPSDDTVQRMMSTAVGEQVPAEYVPMLVEHTQLDPTVCIRTPAAQALTQEEAPLQVAIIGAGASGLAMAVRLGEEGIPFVLFEKNEDVGGTWFENRYPGCAVDTPNHFYQFSFEPNNDWPNYFSSQSNIREYLSKCADKYRVREHIRFGSEVESAVYDNAGQRWTLTVRQGGGAHGEKVMEFNAVICAVGQLNRPMVPDIPGLNDFKGPVLHTAAWPEGTDLTGKRVALVGTGASAVQVGPAIAGSVASLHVFQRSGAWVMRRPNIDRAVSDDTKWALNNIPYYAAWYRFQLFWAFGDGLFEALKIDPEWKEEGSISALNARLRETMLKHIRRELDGRDDLLAKVIPTYPPFGKRVLGDAGWFKMLRRDNVTLINSGIDRVGTHDITASDGSVAEFDAIVLATGFHAGRMLWPMDIRGKSGKSIRETWGDDNPRAFLGITAPDFPNLFIMYGPNTNLGHGGSAIFLAECQARYTIGMLKMMREGNVRSVEIRRDVHDRYNDEIDEKLKTLAWSHPSVNTWYKNSSGRIITNQPWRLLDYWRLTRAP